MAVTGLLLAERLPNEEALALAPTVGWLMLTLAVIATALFIVYREGWRRLWLRMEDPRSLGLFRIAFGICTLCNVNGLWELFEYLFTDEGLFMTDVARAVYAKDQFRGFGNGLAGDPYGFFDAAAFFEWLKGPQYSLLFFDSSPRFFWMHTTAFEISMVMFIVGYKTRWIKWVAWFLFHSTIQRNHVYWEGTENVYRTFFFYVCLSRCDRAFSVDNWLRCRKLRKAGKLSERGGPGGGAGFEGSEDEPAREAVYRLIPAWPRILVVLQCAALYCYTGVVKNGGVWWRGDAFYYAFNLDHFHRIPPQGMASWLGTSLFRVNSHVAHFWESLFPVLVFGMLVRFARQGDWPKPSQAQRKLAGALWVLFGLGVLALCVLLYPTHFTQPKKGPFTWVDDTKMQLIFSALWLSGMVLVWRVRKRLLYRPYRFTLRGKERTIDLEWFLKWIVGRRVWIAVGSIFHLHLIVLMNIGWFSAGCLAGFICFLNGTEIAVFLGVVGRALARIGPLKAYIPESVRKGEPPLPPESSDLPHHRHDAAKLPLGVLVIAAVIALVGVFLTYKEVLAYGWVLVGLAVFLLGAAWRSRGSDAAKERVEGMTRPWAYGPLGRTVVTCLTLYHVVGVAGWLLPDKDSFSWRGEVHKPFKWWLRTTQTTQGWKMFAPNPPRSNMFLRVIVTDVDGTDYDMNTDVYHPANRPIPWIWYTRQRKINRRIAGSEGGRGEWYQKWHARWFCKQWALSHGGELPREVRLYKITYKIPSPEEVWRDGPYDPVERLENTSKEEQIHRTHCRTDYEAQPLDEIRARHGLPPSEDRILRWSRLKDRQKKWEQFKEARARAEEAE